MLGTRIEYYVEHVMVVALLEVTFMWNSYTLCVTYIYSIDIKQEKMFMWIKRKGKEKKSKSKFLPNKPHTYTHTNVRYDLVKKKKISGVYVCASFFRLD